MRKLPPIRTTLERIDSDREVVISYCYRVGQRRYYDPNLQTNVRRPFLYGWSVWAILDRPMHRNDALGWGEGMIQALAERSGGRLPPVGWCSNLPGWADLE